MSWKRKYRCKTCGYEAEVYEGRGLFRQQITPMSCPDCKTIQNIVVGGIIAGVAARKGWAAAAKKAHAAGEDKQVTVDDFAGAWATMDDDMLDAALAKFHKDWGGEGTAREIADELRSSRENSRTVETW